MNKTEKATKPKKKMTEDEKKDIMRQVEKTGLIFGMAIIISHLYNTICDMHDAIDAIDLKMM